VTSAVESTEQLVPGSPGELADEIAVALTIANGDRSNEWEELELGAAEVDRAVRILPGVKTLLESIPEGRYAVATSGAKTYGALRPKPFLLSPCDFGHDWADEWNT
jgi:hypothetical protein